MALNTTPRTWVANEVVTATNLNTEVRDALAGIQAAWTAYTPTPNFTVGNGTLSAAYHRVGKTVHVRCAFTAGTTSSFTSVGTLQIPLPVALNAAYGTGQPLGPAYLLDSSVGSGSRVAGTCNVSGSSVFFVSAKDSNATVTDAVPWTWASGDQILWAATYEAS